MKILAMITLAALSLTACGGSVLNGSGATSTSGTSGSTGDEGEATGTGGTSGTSGTGDTGGTGGTGESAPCVPQPDDPEVDFTMTCADLDQMTVRHPVVHDAGNDGQLSAGESAMITAHLDEITGKGFYWYPYVKFSSDNPAVEVENYSQFYGIAACQSLEVSAQIKVAATVPPGTVVHVTAQVAVLKQECAEAFSISIPIEIH